ncbi:tigger transposable element-derived protein 7-like isoform X2 [Portunus trituberculatus]|nr:tigger transposable element-derived protein 7-like isoform X2 [Portunus trituberculatus]
MEGGSKGAASVYRTSRVLHGDLEEAVYKWYSQQRAAGVVVRGTDIQEAALKLAKHLGVRDFKGSSGWVYRFRKRHGICSKGLTGALLSTNLGAVEPFVQKVAQLMEQEGLHTFQMYNADETGLFWRSLPKNSRAARDISSTLGHRVLEERLSILVGANADGSHRLQPVVVGRSRKPRVLQGLSRLPVEYHDQAAWFTRDIFKDWFHKSFAPAVRKHQTQYGISAEDVRAVLLLDYSPAHPVTNKLCTKDGRVKVMFLPLNTNSALQPMDQGITDSAKRHYKRLYMQQCLVVTEDEDAYEDNRAKKTCRYFRNYNMRDALFNWAEAWSKVPLNTLRNAWCPVLRAPSIQTGENYFEGFDVTAMAEMLAAAGQGSITEEELHEWLEEDTGLSGYLHQTQEEIANEVLKAATMSLTPEEEEEEDVKPCVPPLSAVIEATDTILRHMDTVGGSMARHYEVIRSMRMELMREQQGRKTQPKGSTFFSAVIPSAGKRRRRTSATSDTSLSSLTSNVSSASLHIKSEPCTSPPSSPVPTSSGLIVDDADLALFLETQ